MELHIISGEDTDKYREIINSHVDSFVALLKGRYGRDDVFEQIKEGNWTLWVTHEDSKLKAVIITQVMTYPKIKEFQILLCHGENYKDWCYLISKMEEYAKLLGCDKMVALGRMGWEKILPGYKRSYVCIERELNV